MRTLAFDWATKKALTVYDSQTKKIKEIPNSIEAFEKFLSNFDGKKATMLFEFGGGDSFKIMAYRLGHTILQIPGKKIKDYRDELGEEKSDSKDAELIYKFWKENNGGSAVRAMNKNSMIALPSPKNKNKGRGAKQILNKNSTAIMPSPFYLFKESNADIAELKILFRAHEDTKKEMIREELRRQAFERKFKIANVSGDAVKKILEHKKKSVNEKKKELIQIKRELKKKVKKFPIWQGWLKNVKAVGELIASGLIAEIGDKHFDSFEGLKHYAGMVTKKDFHDYNRYLKVCLYQFAEGIIKHRTDGWREIYDSRKLDYAKKHPDWSKGKVNAYAKKFVETKFLKEFWLKWKN